MLLGCLICEEYDRRTRACAGQHSAKVNPIKSPIISLSTIKRDAAV
jgi:hypothetical protein